MGAMKKTLAVILCVALLLSGCTASTYVDMDRIEMFDGYDYGMIQPIATANGIYNFGARSFLVIRMKRGGGGKYLFKSVDVTETDLVGTHFRGQVAKSPCQA